MILRRALLSALVLSVSLWAAKDASIGLTDPSIDVHDRASIQRGARFFKQSCLACHALKYAVHNEVLINEGILKQSMPVWPEDSWGGHPPPDLSLWALVTSPAFIYTYLTSYYEDNKSPTGFNNLAYPGTSMPNPFASMQGKQVLITRENTPNHSPIQPGAPWYRVIKLDQQGSMTPEQFDQYVKDIVNFLNYIADPSIEERASVRSWIMLYLAVFIVIMQLLYRNYLFLQKRKSNRK